MPEPADPKVRRIEAAKAADRSQKSALAKIGTDLIVMVVRDLE